LKIRRFEYQMWLFHSLEVLRIIGQMSDIFIVLCCFVIARLVQQMLVIFVMRAWLVRLAGTSQRRRGNNTTMGAAATGMPDTQNDPKFKENESLSVCELFV